MNDDDKELLEKLTKAVRPSGKGKVSRRLYEEMEEPDEDDAEAPSSHCQWTTSDEQTYVPASRTKRKLPPGAYEILNSPQVGLYFEKISVKTTDLVRFPDSNSDRVINEIKLFWNSRSKFERFKMPHKRGICLWGPPGAGKSCCVQFVMQDVVERKGIVIKFGHPELFLRGYRILREIQSDTPVVVIMEDIDAILEDWSESSVLNILDGAVDEVENVVFLATTNYPEKLGARVINRPSRFDRRFKIGFPSEEARTIYFNHLFKEHRLEQDDIDVGQWVRDTENMSIAHLRELFVAVIILDNNYDESIEILKSMDHSISSGQDAGGGLGF